MLLGVHIPFKTSPVVLACQHADVSPSDAPRVADALAYVALLLVRVLDERGRRLDQQPPVPRVPAHAVCLHGAVLSLTRTLASVSSPMCVCRHRLGAFRAHSATQTSAWDRNNDNKLPTPFSMGLRRDSACTSSAL